MKKLVTLLFLLFGAMAVEAQSRFQLLHEMPFGRSRFGNTAILSSLQIGDTLFWISGNNFQDRTCKVGLTNLRTGQYTVISDTLKGCTNLTKFGSRVLFYSNDNFPISLWSWDKLNGLTLISSECEYVSPYFNPNTNTEAPIYFFRKRDLSLWGLPSNQQVPFSIGQPSQWQTTVQILGDSILAFKSKPADSLDIWLFSPITGNGRKIASRNLRLASQPIFSQSLNLISWIGIKGITGTPIGNNYEFLLEELNLTTGIVSSIDTALSRNNFGNLPLATIKYQNNVLLYTKRGVLWAFDSLNLTALSNTQVTQISMPERQKSLFLANKELWETDGIGFNRILEASRNNNDGYSLYDLKIPDGSKLFTASDRASSNLQAWLLHPDSIAPRLIGIMPHIGQRNYTSERVPKFYFLNGEIYAFIKDPFTIRVFVNSTNGLRLIASYNTVIIQPEIGEVFWLNNKIVFTMLADISKGKEYYAVENGNIALLKEVRQGSLGLHIAGQIQLRNELLFEATDGINGFEQWVTDGTASGTRMIENFSQGGRSSDWRMVGSLDNDKLALLNVNSKDFSVRLYLYNSNLTLTPVNSAPPRTYEWNKLVGTNDNTDHRSFTSSLGFGQDSLGNLYNLIVGSCISYLDEGKTARMFTENSQIYYPCGSAFQISKRNPNGELTWARSVGGRSTSVHAPAMAINRNGKIGIIYYSNSESFLDTLVFNSFSQQGNTILAEFDTNGAILWYKQLSLDGAPEIHSIVYDNDNNLVVTGKAGTFDDNSGLRFVSIDNKNNFVASFSPYGTTRWAKHINSFRPNYPVRTSQLICNKENNIYLLASIPEYNSPGYCDGDTSEMYILKLRSYDGVFDWERTITAEQRCAFEWSSLDLEENLHIRGMYNGKIGLQDGTELNGTCDGFNYFSLVISPQGTTIDADTLDNTKSSWGVYFSPKGIKYDVFRNINRPIGTYKEGYFHKYYHGSFGFSLNASIRGVFLRDYVFNYGPSTSDPFINIRRPLITFDKEDNIILSTYSSGPLDTLPNFAAPESLVFSNGSYLHIVKFKPLSTNPPSVPDAQLAASDITLYPNPTSGYLVLQSDDRDFANMQYQVFDVIGRPIAALKGESYGVGYQTLDVTPYAQGTYFLRCMLDGKTLTTLKFVKL